MSEDTVLNLKPFNVNDMATHSVVVVIGKRKTGKTVLIRDLLYHKQNIPLGLVMSHTDHLTHFYDQFIPSMLIHKDYDSDQVGKLFQRQTKALQEHWKEPSAFLLLDDVLSDKAWKSCSNLKEVFFNGRHYKLLFILGMQSPMGIGPDLRNNIDYTFIFKNNLQSERRKIYDNYAGVFKTFEIFNHVLEATTEDYNCLVIVNNSLSNKLEDQVFYYKATENREFRLCSNDIWSMNEKRDLQTKINKHNGNYVTTENSLKKGKGKIIITKKN